MSRDPSTGESPGGVSASRAEAAPASAADGTLQIEDADRGRTADDLTGRPAYQRDVGRRARGALPSVVGVAVAIVVVLALRLTGSLRGSEDALVIMGFDPDRARLLTALLAGALAAACVALADGHPALAVLVSVGAAAAVFGSTFARETQSAMDATGAQGTFDLGGWLLSVLTLLEAALVVGWAAGTLTGVVRRYATRALREAGASLRSRPPNVRGLLRALSLLVAATLLVATLPVFADMVNYAPDAHMRRAEPLSGGLPGVTAGSSPVAVASGQSSLPPSVLRPNPSALPTGLVAGPLPGSLVSPGVLSTSRPWASSAPTGVGQLSRFELRGPWTRGVVSVARVDVYLPPGYGSGSTHYPVLYEVPYVLASWVKGVGIASMLDSLITSGAIPPMIMIFASTYGGPYPDSECADSYDGTEHFDSYMATELVPYMDAHYRTIASAPGRVLIGASQGGYCAAAVWSHHPTVFGGAVSFSGYFVAGVSSPETQNAARPFGGNAAYEASQSPIESVTHLSAEVALRSFVVLSADLGNAFFGQQLRAYAAALQAAGVPMAILPAPLGHSWQTQRAQLPGVLEMVAARMVQLGVLGPT